MIKSCQLCGLVQHVPPAQPRVRYQCVRCHSLLADMARLRRQAGLAAALALSALVLYWPGILLPVLEVEKLGFRFESSILSGTLTLLREGHWFVGGIILVFSLIFPLVKLALLLHLSLFAHYSYRRRALMVRLLGYFGRWSMIDVFLAAFLVMLVKLGDIVRFHPGPALIAFSLSVLFSLLASAAFNPHVLWDDENPS